MDRQVFGTARWRAAVGVVVALAAGLILPVMAALGQRPTGLWLVIVTPVVLVPLAGWLAWRALIRPPSVIVDASGLAVTYGPHRFALPWAQVHRVGVLREGERGVPIGLLLAWPVTPPSSAGGKTAVVFDAQLGGYILIRRPHLTATDDELAAAVERYAPGRWGVPAR